jgi:hypothetical protein
MLSASGSSSVQCASLAVGEDADGDVVTPFERVKNNRDAERITNPLDAARLRQPIQIDEQYLDDSQRYPRWAVLLGVIAYCVVAWAVVFQLGGSATEWVASLFSAGVDQQASVSGGMAP